MSKPELGMLTTGVMPTRRRNRSLAIAILVSMLFSFALPLLVAGTAQAAEPASVKPATTCNQPSYVWLLTDNGRLGTPPNDGGTVKMPHYWYLDFAGVMQPGTGATLYFQNQANGAIKSIPSRNRANGNCVLNQEPNRFVAGTIGIGTYTVSVAFTPWEIGYQTTEPMGTLVITS